ncbi:hypothetical protein [Eudoraea chungangensis]|uniref:hypothetical protein n=1 Tax=Eudoraea chungangensis TaxID=1481905 RepID=UPI0023EC9381|nr:hypothetical protein [Eudoraea chungangensis]
MQEYTSNELYGLRLSTQKRLDYLEELLGNWEKNSTIPEIHKMPLKGLDFTEQVEKTVEGI